MRVDTILYNAINDRTTAERLFEAHQGYAIQYANKYKTQENLDDLRQVCMMGLWSACLTFDAGRGLKFTTHAMWYLRAEVQDYLRRAGRVRGRGKGELVPRTAALDHDRPRYEHSAYGNHTDDETTPLS